MKISRLPLAVIDRLVALDQHAALSVADADRAEAALTEARRILNDIRPASMADRASGELRAKTQSSFDAVLKAVPAARQRASDAKRVASSAKAFVAGLPEDAELELAEAPQPNGVDLGECRGRIGLLRAEITKLRNAPMPSDDIEARVKDYVDTLARKPLLVRGIGAGQNLEFEWPLSLEASVRGGYISTTANPLMLAARLLPAALVADLLAEIARVCETPCPPGERGPRLAALEAQLTQLQSLEAHFVNGAVASGETEVTHDPTTPVPIILGMCVVGRA